MIKVYRVPISKSQFRQLPQADRGLVVVAGHVLNQIAVFRKLLQFSMNKDPADQIEALASGTQTQMLLRVLIGIMGEFCVFVEERQTLIEVFLADMHQEGQDAYSKIKLEFDHKALLRRIRGNFLYHYPNEKLIDKGLDAASDDEPWEWFLSDANTNSLYFSCDLILNHGLVKETKAATPEAAFEMVMQKMSELADLIPNFLMRLIQVIMVKHLGPDIFKPQAHTMISGAPNLYEFWVPFYAEPDR